MTDERDPKLSRRYRELGGDEPSRELDQAILAAAHRAADQPHAPLVTPAGRHRWYFSLAAAAVLVLTVGIALHMERQQPDTDMGYASQAPEPAPAPPPTQASAQKQAEQKREAPRRRAQAESYAPQTAAPVEERSGNAAAPAAAPPEPRAAARMEAQSNVGAMLSRADRAAETPERELERIAELRRQARDEEADKALADFRKRYPDYRISAEMLQRVEKAVPAAR